MVFKESDIETNVGEYKRIKYKYNINQWFVST